MSMSVTLSVRKVFPQGLTSFAPRALPTGFTEVKIAIDRTNWTDTNSSVALLCELSQDNGITWNEAGRFTASGGVILDRHGNVLTESFGGWPFAQPDNSQRQIRASITVAGTVDASLTATLLP
jgi:hypothetical protein